MKYWRHSTKDDVAYVAMRLRDADRLEVDAMKHSPLAALHMGYIGSDICYTLLSPEGKPIAMLGVVPSQAYENLGAIWLLGTEGIEQYGYRFLRHSKQCLQELYDKTGYDAFYNATHKDNHVHHKWLRWLGFTFLRRITIDNSYFIEFVRLKG